jgi:protease-4
MNGGSETPPAGGAPWYPATERPGRPVSFYVAIFLGLLLVVSIALNLLLLVVSAVGSLTGASGVAEEDGANWRLVQIGGDESAPKQVLRVHVTGAIAEAAMPLLGAPGGTVTQVRQNLALAAREESVAGVIFDIDSPGGGVGDSDEIHRLIREFRADHPDKVVIALLGDTAASGGYYIAVACQHILARPTTVTGSIGVIMQSWNFAEAMAEHGIDQITVIPERAPYKDLLSFSRRPTEAELQILRNVVEELYDRFVTVVDEGRPNLDRQEVLALATGAIWAAQQARANGLVDGIGSIEDAHEFVTRAEQVGPARLVERRRVPGLFDSLFGIRRATPPALDTALHSLLGSTTGPRFLYYWPGGR